MLRPSAIGGWAGAALASLEYGNPAIIAVCTAAGGPNHGEAEDPVVILTDKSFHEAFSLIVANTCFAPAPICA
jgi:hypothetical protein